MQPVLGLFLWLKIPNQSHFSFHDVVDQLSHVPPCPSRQAFDLLLQPDDSADYFLSAFSNSVFRASNAVSLFLRSAMSFLIFRSSVWILALAK